MALTDETSPFYVGGGFQVLTSAMKAEPRISENFTSGKGMPWGDHDHGLFQGTERFFRPGYEANLVHPGFRRWMEHRRSSKPEGRSRTSAAAMACTP